MAGKPIGATQGPAERKPEGWLIADARRHALALLLTMALALILAAAAAITGALGLDVFPLFR